MKTNRELKSLAKDSMKGYTGTLIISLLICMVASGTLPIIGQVLTIGLYAQAFYLSIGMEPKIEHLILDLKTIGRIMLAALIIGLISGLIIYILAFILIGIGYLISSLFYFENTIIVLLVLSGLILFYTMILAICILLSQVYFILIEDKDISAIDAIKYSIELTKNNKLRILSLYISFLPLFFVGSILLLIPFIWITPYYIVTNAQLYIDLKEQYYMSKMN